MHPDLLIRAHMIVDKLTHLQKRLTLAESCTGGLIAACLTSVPGSSAILREGWVCYSAEAKQRDLSVSPELIEIEGIVSEPVALAMAQGALRRSSADYAIAITGNAGPTAEPGDAPVGQVCIALVSRSGDFELKTACYTDLERLRWRDRVVALALDMLLVK